MHRFGIPPSQFEDMSQFHRNANLNGLAAAQAEIASRHHPQIMILGLEITPRRDVAEVCVITVGARDEVLSPLERPVRQYPYSLKPHRAQRAQVRAVQRPCLLGCGGPEYIRAQ